MKTERVRILIRHNLHNSLPAEVLTHEIPVLRVLRGESNITFLESITDNAGDVNPRAEFLRLKQEYQSRRDGEGTNPVDAAYPDGARDLEIVLRDGLDAFDRMVKGEPEIVEDEEPLTFSDDEEPLIGDDADDEVEMDRASIIAKLQELDVSFSLNTPTKHLLDKLHAAEASQ